MFSVSFFYLFVYDSVVVLVNCLLKRWSFSAFVEAWNLLNYRYRSITILLKI